MSGAPSLAYGLRHPSPTPSLELEHLSNRKEVNNAALLLPEVVMKDHMRALAAEAPDVVRMVVTSVAVDVMDHLFRERGTAQLPLGDGPVLIVVFACLRVRALLVAGHELKAH